MDIMTGQICRQFRLPFHLSFIGHPVGVEGMGWVGEIVFLPIQNIQQNIQIWHKIQVIINPFKN